MTSWTELNEALDATAGRGEICRFWWRDDDAGKSLPALTRLLEMAERQDLSLALAVIPAWLQPEVQGQIAAQADTTVLQHGFTHANHASDGEKSIELGSRSPDLIAKELKEGFVTLEDAFGAAFLPILVPPWNRIDPALHAFLRAGGYVGLSVFGKRAAAEIAPGVSLVNTHLDPIDWRGSRGFLGEDVMLERLIDQLDPEEPIGILSHHLVMDEPCWAFLGRLFEALSHHPAARLCSASQLFMSLDLTGGHAA